MVKSDTKYVAVVGQEVVAEFKSLTAAMIWQNSQHFIGNYGAELKKVENHIIKDIKKGGGYD